MNRLLEHLRKEGTPSIEALKRLSRTQALKVHPDVSKKSDSDFIRLQDEYEGLSTGMSNSFLELVALLKREAEGERVTVMDLDEVT